MELWRDFLTNKGKAIHKWEHYFPAYERHLASWKGRTLTLFEIGVACGGSLSMWRRYLGPMAVVVGLDIDQRCREHEENGAFVRIGDQSDVGFLDRVVGEFGVPDIVIDDGSHIMDDISRSFDHLYPQLSKNGVYIVEDLHTAYWADFGGGLEEPGSFITKCKRLIDQLNADHSRGALDPDFFTRSTSSMTFYDSMVVFEKGPILHKIAPAIGIQPRKRLFDRTK